MSSGKAAARDLVHGRQGGRWADTPVELTDEDRRPQDRTQTPCRTCEKLHRKPRLYGEHTNPCPYCVQDSLHHRPGDVDLEVQARAQMATARISAGLPLTDLDRMALDVWGDQDLGHVRPANTGATA
jgi:hypothetical protein